MDRSAVCGVPTRDGPGHGAVADAQVAGGNVLRDRHVFREAG